ncbi:MAG: LamG-like jellyroll fold domain-containing protein [Cytophagales bacterium]|nr:LamG-like jellyroll fold domain-containing protein [Cytophagales bacterium]
MYSANFRRALGFLTVVFTLFISFSISAQNNALDFDGSNDVVTTSDFFEFRTDYTVEAWVNTTATTGMIVSKWDAGDGNSTFSLQLSSGRPWASNNEAPFSFVSSITINDGNWHHIAVTYDLSATTITMYVDGILDITNSSAGVNGTQNDINIAIGAEADGGTPLDGTIDEVRIWNDVRTDEELALNMNHELSGSESGLIAYYNFNQGTAGGSNGSFTSLPDESTNSNTGTLSNFVLTGSSSNYLSGFSATNHALDFDGTNDFVNVASPNTSFGTEISVEAWINLATLTSAEGVMGQSTANSDNSGTNVWLLGNIGTSDGSLTFFVWDGSNVRSATSTTDFAGTGWHHVVGVADATSTRIYVDGTLEASGTGISSGVQSNGSAIVHLGKDSRYSSARFADGLIDEVRIWSDARTCSEILSTKDVELTGSETGLVAYYNFNHGFASGTNSGLTTLPDLSGNNSDGTLTNFALSSTSSNYLDGSGNSVSGNTPAAQPEINVQGNSNDITDGSTAINGTINTDFGTQTSSNAIVYTIQNTGSTTLTISSITATGTNAGDFVISGAPTTVASSGSETFTVTFGPLATGTRNATININSDDCDEAAYDFAVQGVGDTNHALDFDGSDDFVALTKINLFTGLSYEAWIRTTSTDATSGYAGNSAINIIGEHTNDIWNSFGVHDGKVRYSHFTGSWNTLESTTSVNDGNWHHVAVTHNQSTGEAIIYVDGTAEGTSTISYGAGGGSAKVGLTRIGGSYSDGTNTADFFDGDIDEVRVWNNTRSCSQILSTKDVELTGSESGLVGYYNFNQNDAGGTNTGQTTLDDLTSNNNDGTLTGFSLSGSTSNWIDGSGNNVSNSTTPADQPEINVQGNSNDIADGSTAINGAINTDFGTQTSSNAIVYTIQNTGSTTLNISSITSTGTNAGDFVISGAPTTVASSGSETFTVTFGPLATGTRNATININSDDCDEAAYDFAVQGVGDTNHALDFDGADDDIIVSGFAASTGSWTYEFLFSPTSTLTSADAREDLFYYSTGGRPHITFNRQGNGSIGIHTDIGGSQQDITTTTTTWTSGTWYHIAFSYDGTAVRAYVNGTEENSLNVSEASNAASTLNIGSAGSTNYFAGQMDEVRIWSVARTCSEILSTKDVELTGSETGLELYYNFNQNEAGGTNTGQTTLDDLTSNNNDGTLTGFALTGSTSNWVDGSGNNVSNSTTPANQPEINVQGNNNDIADGSTTINTTIDTDFGISSNAIVYTIQNTGTATLNISSITSTGTNSSEFVVSGVPSTIAASGSETFTVTFTSAGSGTRMATITINSDDCNEAAYDFAVQGSGAAPGGFGTDLQLWLKAGTDFTASQWDDQSGNSNHATQGTASAQPASTANAINFNTAIDFDGSDFLTLTNDAGTMGLNNSDYELFFIANTSQTDVRFLISAVTQERYEMHLNGDAGHRFIPANATNISDIGSASDYADGIARIFGGTLQSSGASAASHVNGLFTTDIETAGLQTTETGAITIGRREFNDSFHWLGQMGEVIIYGDAMTSTQRQQVFSYLALKYGITLDQTSATDYLAADGATVWNATINAAYNDDIAGLARDDASELGQRQSESINSGAILELANGTHASPSTYSADDSWLIWGHDGGATTFGSGNINNSNATTSNRMARVWRAQETGTVGGVEIRFSNSLAAGTVSLVAHTSDANFPADGNRRVVEMVDDGTHYSASIDLADGEYFSFANANYATLTSQFVVINEVITDPQQDWGASNFFNPSPGGTGDSDDEWVELYIASDNLDLTNWTIEMNDGTNESGSVAAGGAFNQSNYRSLTGGFFNNTKAGDYLILGDPSSGMMNSVGGLTVVLKDGSGGTIDQVTIATGSGTGFSGSASSTTDESVARIPNGSDTDVDATDFVKTRATLGESSTPSGTVVINEVVTDPFTDWSSGGFDGSDGGSTVSNIDEWVELYIGTDGLNLTGWTISLIDGSGDVVDQSIAAGGAFSVNQYYGSGSFINTSAGDYLVLGNPGSGTSAMNNDVQIILKDASGNTIDQVQLGGGSGEAPDGGNSAFNSEAVVRYPNAADTGTDNVDFIQTRPTLGTTNSPTGTVVINEIVTDPKQDWSSNGFDGTIGGTTIDADDEDEWIELYIASSEINLTGWTISLEDGNGDIVDQSLAAGGAFSTSNYIAASIGSFVNTEAGDFLVLGNPTGSGTVQMDNNVQITLKDASGNTVDQVKLGGGSGEAPSGASTVISDEAIARIPNGTDTDNNASDFTAGPATLGAVNQTAQLPGVGNGLVFDGTNDLVNLGSQILSSSTFTVEAWVNGSSFTNSGRFNRIMAINYGSYTSDNPFVLFVDNSGNIGYVFGTGDASTDQQVPLSFSPTLSTSTWYHVALTFDGSNKRLYVDGVLYGTINDAGTFTNTNSEPLLIGDFDTSTSDDGEWEGSIDEVRIWNDVRTHEEIVENMMGLLNPSESNLQAYYRFDQSSGTTLPDLTSNGNNGTLTNMAGTEWAAAGWDIFAQNQAIFQSGGSDTSTGTSGELTLTDASFLNDDNDLLLAGHDNGSFNEVASDLPSGTLLTARYDRIWNLKKNDASGTSNGSVRLGFDLGATPDVTYTYYLLERTGTSGDFAIVPALGINPNSNSVEFTVDASAIDNASYYTLGRSDAGVGNALNLDGSNDYIDLGDLTLTTGTVEMWLNPDALPANQRIYAQPTGATTQQGSLGINPQNDGNDYDIFVWSGSAWLKLVDLSADWSGEWHHLVVVYSGGSATAYWDGVQQQTQTTNFDFNGVVFGLGSNYTGPNGTTWDGNFDEVRIWSDARTQQEILDNMFANLTGDEANLAAYYRFNQGIGDSNTSLPDLSSNSNGGTLNNFANLGGSTTSSNYIASTRTAITTSVIISNGGDLSATDGELALTSTQNAGDFLQDSNDFIRWNNDGGAFTETTADVPSTTQVTTRYTKTWQLDKNDAVGTANGNVTFTFDLGAVPDPDYTYFVLSRSGTSGDFSIVEALSSSPSGNTISFTVDAGEITDDNYFTLGRTDAGAGNTIDFDADNDYIDVADADAFTFGNGTTDSPFSIETWVRIDNTAEFTMISKKSGGLAAGEWYMGSGTGGQYHVTLWDESAGGSVYQQTAAGLFTAGEWYHLAFTYDGSGSANGLTLYVDGIASNDGTGGSGSYTAMENTTSSVQFGVVTNTFSNLDGALDEIRIWSDERTEQEIRDNMNRKLDVANESNLIAYYQFNTGIAGGTNTGVDVLTDRSGNGNSGTLTNLALSGTASNWVASTATVADQTVATSLQGAGNALDFDGVDEFVAIADNATLESSSTLTIEAWIRPDVTTSFRGIVSRYFTSGDASNAYLIEINSGNYNFTINESDNNLVTASAAATASTWTHVAGVADGTNVNIYIDGILIASTAYDGTITSNSSRGLFIGKYRTDDLFGPYDGLIDEVRIWNTARTGAEIQANMFESLTGNESGLVAYYTFDESSGTTLDDNSANTNTGTLNNMEDADWVDASAREPFKTNGPGNLNSGGTWIGGAAPGASQTLYVQHDLTVDANLTVDDFNLTSGNTLTLGAGQTLTITGNLVNNGTITGDGKIQFTSGNPMISGGTFSNLEMNGGSPVLCGNTTLTGTLTMTSGNLQLEGFNLTLNSGASISGGSSSSYIQTLNQNSSGGSISMEIGSSNGVVTYPIGTSTNYTPIFFTNLGSTATFAIRTFDGIYTENTSGTAITSEVINKTWDVNATGSGFNVTLSIQWNTADETSGFDRTNMFVSTNDGSGWVQRSGQVSASEVSSGIYQATASGITGFSGVGGGGDVITPVTLLDFYALEMEEAIELVWHTATEINNEKFMIERSADGIEFTAIDEIPGNGDSDDIIEYRYVDTEPFVGSNYYRLKQMDFDGEFEYSPIVLAETERITHDLVVYPNPFSDRLYIGLKEADVPANVKLTSMNGQVILSESVISDNRFVQFEDLQASPGIYILEIEQSGEVVRMRIVNE